jgi:hypothetical protein
MIDYQCQLLAIERMQSTAGDDFKDPRLVSQHGVVNAKANRPFQSSSKAGIPKGVYTIPYLLHAYDVPRSTFKRRKKEMKEGTVSKPDSEKMTYNQSWHFRHQQQPNVQEKLLSGGSPAASCSKGNWQTHMARQKYWGSVYDELAPRGEINDVEKYTNV